MTSTKTISQRAKRFAELAKIHDLQSTEPVYKIIRKLLKK